MEARIRYIDIDLRAARRKLAALIEIARWVWVINGAVMLVGAYFGRADIGALAGFTWLLTLIAAAIARRVATNLGGEPDASTERPEFTER